MKYPLRFLVKKRLLQRPPKLKLWRELFRSEAAVAEVVTTAVLRRRTRREAAVRLERPRRAGSQKIRERGGARGGGQGPHASTAAGVARAEAVRVEEALGAVVREMEAAVGAESATAEERAAGQVGTDGNL